MKKTSHENVTCNFTLYLKLLKNYPSWLPAWTPFVGALLDKAGHDKKTTPITGNYAQKDAMQETVVRSVMTMGIAILFVDVGQNY